MAEFQPFDPNIHKPKDIGLGGPSTEYLVTIDSPDGQVMVVPSIWWDEKGNPTFLGNIETGEIDQDKIVDLVTQYEKNMNQMFPRFGQAGVSDNYRIADRFATSRSKTGGASKVPLINALDQDFSEIK